MRQIGSIPNGEQAQRFVAWLITQRIPAHVEQEGDAWAIWVKNEDQVQTAKDSLAEFQRQPNDPRYQGAQAKAEALVREEVSRHQAARKNVVEMRGQWRSPGGGAGFRSAPLTFVMIGLTLFVAMLTQLGNPRADSPSSIAAMRALSFADPLQRGSVRRAPMPGSDGRLVDGFAQIRQGQVWRLVTPIFIHFGMMHLVFNMIMFYQLGTLVERRYGTWRLGLAILVIAIASNTLQYYWEHSYGFGGMSGVVYGIFGFIWMKSLFDPRSGLYMSKETVVILLGWMFLCMAASLPLLAGMLSSIANVANTAHFVGLATGMALAFVPRLFES